MHDSIKSASEINITTQSFEISLDDFTDLSYNVITFCNNERYDLNERKKNTYHR